MPVDADTAYQILVKLFVGQIAAEAGVKYLPPQSSLSSSSDRASSMYVTRREYTHVALCGRRRRKWRTVERV